MNTKDPQPKFSDQKLLAYLDGEVESETAKQIEGSSADLQRARELAGLQNILTESLYRVDCPDSIELGEYHIGLLDRTRRRVVRQHVQECPHCTKELEQISQFLAAEQPKPAESPLDRVKILVGRLISQLDEATRPPGLAPALAVRGGEKQVIVYEAGEVQITLDLREAEETGQESLLGLVTGLEAQGFSVELLSNRKQVALGEVDELGNFELSGFPPDVYVLLIRGPDLEIHLPDLEL